VLSATGGGGGARVCQGAAPSMPLDAALGHVPAPESDFNEFAEEVRARLREIDRKLDSLCSPVCSDGTHCENKLLPYLPEAVSLQPAWLFKNHNGHDHASTAPARERRTGLTCPEERKTGIVFATEEHHMLRPTAVTPNGTSHTNGISVSQVENRRRNGMDGASMACSAHISPTPEDRRVLNGKGGSIAASSHPCVSVREEEKPRSSPVSVASFASRPSSPPKDQARRNAKAQTMTSRSRHRPVMLSHIWMFMEDAESSRGAYWFSVFFPMFTVTTVAVSLLQTIKPPILDWGVAAVLELSFDLVFALELVLRFISCPNYRAFFRNGYNLIDLACVAPIFIRASVGFRLDSEETAASSILLCVVPLLRLLKTLRRFQEIQLLWAAFVGAWEALPVLLYTAFTMNLMFSALIFLIEPRSNVPTFGKAMWLTLVTMMTIGYGDMTPQSDAGTVVVSFLIVCSCLYMAMPLGIVGQIFFQIWEQRDRILVMKRTRAALTQWGYQAHDIPMLFDLFDTNGDGYLALDEFQQMIDFLDLGMSRSRVRRLFDTFDVDGGGTVSDAEFVRGLFPSYYHDLFMPGGFGMTPEGPGGPVRSETQDMSGAGGPIPFSRGRSHSLQRSATASMAVDDDAGPLRRGSMVVVRGRRGSALMSRRFDTPQPNELVRTVVNSKRRNFCSGSEGEESHGSRYFTMHFDNNDCRATVQDSPVVQDGMPMPMVPNADKSEDFYSM